MTSMFKILIKCYVIKCYSSTASFKLAIIWSFEGSCQVMFVYKFDFIMLTKRMAISVMNRQVIRRTELWTNFLTQSNSENLFVVDGFQLETVTPFNILFFNLSCSAPSNYFIWRLHRSSGRKHSSYSHHQHHLSRHIHEMAEVVR